VAHLVRPVVTSYELNGKRVQRGTCGAKKVRRKASKWYGQGVPGYPPKKRVPLATDKQVARRMLADLVSGSERGMRGLPDVDAGRKPLADHLEAFRGEMAQGMASRSKKKRLPTSKQVELTVGRIRTVFDGCGFNAVAALNTAAPNKLAGYLQRRSELSRKDGGLSHQTAAFALAATRRFVWWLSAKARAPVRADLFDDVPGFDPRNNRVHARREITPDELGRLLTATRYEPARSQLPGRDRYHLYLLAFATGFRAGELSQLRPEFFDLDAPEVTVPAKHTKNKKPVRQPLPPGVAYQFAEYLAGKSAGQPLWPGKWASQKRGAAILRGDLEAAGIPYKVITPDGPRYADFHSLRHSFVSALAAAGVGVKELQELARHSSPQLTLGVYAHTRTEALGASVARLPMPGADEVNPLANLTRAELDSTVAELAALLSGVLSLFAPPLAPKLATGWESLEPAGNGTATKWIWTDC
jgi:integrase